jgi:plastocyanin
MVCITSTFLTAAVIFSSLVAGAPAKRQEVQNQETLTPIDPGAIPSVDPNGSAGGSVQISTTSTESSSSTIETSSSVETSYNPVETYAPPPPSGQHTGLPSYGSGSVTWQGNYNDCVQKCFVVNNVPGTTVELPPSHNSNNNQHEGSKCDGKECPPSPPPSPEGSPIAAAGGENSATGNGVTHNIMVEPVSGAVRMVPAFINVNAGDSVIFTIVNGQHSIVQSSATSPCNASANGFNSGPLSAGQTFTQVIQSTEPIFMFSDISGDCAAGLFGAINAATGNENSTTTVSSLMPQWAASNADIDAQLTATNALASQTAGLEWANKLDVADIPPEQYPTLASNILFTRAVIGQNPDMVGKDGVWRPSGSVVIPADRAALFIQADIGGYGYPAEDDSSSDGPTGVPQNAAAQPTSTEATGNGVAIGATSSRVAIAGFAVLVAFLAF